MGDSEETAAQSVLSGDDDNPLAGQDLSGGPSGQPQPTTSSTATASPIQVDSTQKVHPHVAILAGLVNKVLGGLQNAPGNPNNAFDRGFMGASPQVQKQRQQQAQMALTEQQQADVNLAMSRVKLANAMNQASNLDPATQQKTISAAYKQGEQDRSNGSILKEEQIDGEGYAAFVPAQQQALQHNQEEVKAGSRNRWEVIASNEDPKHATFSVVQKNMDGIVKKSVPKISKDETGNDMWDGESYEEKQGTQAGLDAISAHGISLYTKGATQDFIKQMHATLGNQKAPETQDDADYRLSQLQQFVNLAGKTDPVWTKMAQDEMATIKKIHDSLPKNQAELKKAERPPQQEQGTWSLVEDTEGKPMLLNSKTGERKPAPGVQKAGTFAKGEGAGEAAIRYGTSYLASGEYTGAGDEALLEKYFELAKPSSGFRMTQAQMELLQRGRSWVEAAKAKAGYIVGGKLFSDEQRRQIVNTMKMLQKAKGGNAESGGSTPSTDPFAAFGGKQR